MRTRPPRLRISLAISLAVHAALLLVLSWVRPAPPPEPPPPRILELELRSRGPSPAEVAGEADVTAEPPAPEASAPPPSPPPTPRQSPSSEPRPAPVPAQPAPAVASGPVGEVAPAAPEPKAPPAQPQSFEQWRAQRMARYAGSASAPRPPEPGGGSPDATALRASQGRDRCEPSPGRRVHLVYLLFDSSGSLGEVHLREAITCARQYAKASLERGAVVLVVNFANGARVSRPTRSLMDVEFSLRTGPNPNATLIPGRELGRILDERRGTVADLVIVSDAYISNAGDAMPWYRYFMELNPDNRGVMYTIGSHGPPRVVHAFQEIGFDVHLYRMR